MVSVLFTSATMVSGTIGLGSLAYFSVTQATKPTTGTALTINNNNMNQTSGIAQAFTASTVAATPTLHSSPYTLAATNPWVTPGVDEVAGRITILPGYALTIQGIAAAGSTPLVIISATWEEVNAY